MGKFLQGLKAISDIGKFKNLPREHRRIVFYCEDKNYWVHIKALLQAVLQQTNIPVCYITSSREDIGLEFQHPQLQHFFVGFGETRNNFFKNIDTDVMIMTMPDLNCYQVKRSHHNVRYIYVQHSLVSLHMVYRHGAFDHYDIICCAGSHHKEEVRALEKKYNLPKKVTHGVGLFTVR